MEQWIAVIVAALITAAANIAVAVISNRDKKAPADTDVEPAPRKVARAGKRIVFAIATIAAVGIAVYLLWPRADHDGWAGEWKISSQGKAGILQGSMRLMPSDNDSVTGHYTNSVGQDTISGTVAGQLSHDGRTLRGTWLNDRGLEGLFVLRLGQGNTSFYGSYSMFQAPPERAPQNWWKGTKIR